MSEDSLSYLQDFEFALGSPFDLGRAKNVSLFFNPPKKYFYLWEGQRRYLKEDRKQYHVPQDSIAF